MRRDASSSANNPLHIPTLNRRKHVMLSWGIRGTTHTDTITHVIDSGIGSLTFLSVSLVLWKKPRPLSTGSDRVPHHDRGIDQRRVRVRAPAALQLSGAFDRRTARQHPIRWSRMFLTMLTPRKR